MTETTFKIRSYGKSSPTTSVHHNSINESKRPILSKDARNRAFRKQ